MAAHADKSPSDSVRMNGSSVNLVLCCPLIAVMASLLTSATTLANAEPLATALALIETTTHAPMGEAVRVYTQIIYLDSGTPDSPPRLLPGSRSVDAPLPSGDAHHFAITTAESFQDWSGPPATFVSVVDSESGSEHAFDWLLSDDGWSQYAAAFVPETDKLDPGLVILATPNSANAVGPGRVEVSTWRSTGRAEPEGKLASWLLPGRPVAAVVLPESSLVAVLCGKDGHETRLHVRDLTRGEVIVKDMPVFAETRETNPVALVRCGTYGPLLSMVTGPGSDPGNVYDSTWVRAIDPVEWDGTGPPLELNGIPGTSRTSVQVATDGSFWIGTREPQSGFAYAVHARVTASGIEKLAEYSFSGTTRVPRIAVNSNDGAIAIGLDERVEVWPSGVPDSVRERFTAPVNALAWCGKRLLVGEGNRLHEMHVYGETATPRVVTSFQTGVVTAIATPDAVRPAVPISPPPAEALRVEPPRFVRFRAESAGRELRAVQVIPSSNDRKWRLNWDRERTPWLNAYPKSGTGPSWFLMGVDNRFVTPGTTDTGWVDLVVTSSADSELTYRIATRVAPSHPPVRRILWVVGDSPSYEDFRSDDDPYSFKTLADLLAAPPHHFSHRQATGPITDSLTPFTIVVLDSRAVATGTVTRQAVLDFVSGGGALLYLPRRDSADGNDIARWFVPAGLLIDQPQASPDRFIRATDTSLTRNVGEWPSPDASGLIVDPAWKVLMASPDGRYAGFAIREYGSGRIAALGTTRPLESDRLNTAPDRWFADALFSWLGDSGVDFQDLDDDGLADDQEDRDGDGAVGPGETDRLNPDSDGDGVPDGAEDQNRNGSVDPGETDPLNPDTDGDGTFDGADMSPTGITPVP